MATATRIVNLTQMTARHILTDMHDAVPPSQRTSYSAIIDSILADADLETISAKRIRKGLQERIDHDLTDQKVSPPPMQFPSSVLIVVYT